MIPSLRALKHLTVPSNGFRSARVATALQGCLKKAAEEGYRWDLESLNVGNNHFVPEDLYQICATALHRNNVPSLRKLVIAFSNLGDSPLISIETFTIALDSGNNEYIGGKLCKLLLNCSQRLETLDFRCCNLTLSDMKVL